MQALCTFFIDAANFIPLENNFWGYFLIIETFDNPVNKANWHTIGFTSHKIFHIELDKYYTMISQFLVLPSYQRKEIGTFLLENCYKYLSKVNKCCLEVTTEDPDIEFILMRDYTICKILVTKKFIDNLLISFKGNIIETKNVYDQFHLNKDELKNIYKTLKLQENLLVVLLK